MSSCVYDQTCPNLGNLLIVLPEVKAHIGTCAHSHTSTRKHMQTQTPKHTYTQAQAQGHTEHSFKHGQEHVSVEKYLLGEH